MAAFNLASKMAAKLSFQVYLEFTATRTKIFQFTTVPDSYITKISEGVSCACFARLLNLARSRACSLRNAQLFIEAIFDTVSVTIAT